MSRTGGRFEGKTPFTDAVVDLAAQDFQVMSGVATTFVKNGSGLIVQNVGASLSPIFVLDLGCVLMRKIGQLPFLQEQFGTAAGVAGPTAVANTGDPDSGQGVPPLTGNKPITPLSGFFPKGINILDITLEYLITTVPLTTHTIGLTKTVFSNNIAPVVTNVLANAANGLATAVNAQPYVTKVPVNSGFLTTDLSHYIIELDVVVAATGGYQLSGGAMHIQYNYN